MVDTEIFKPEIGSAERQAGQKESRDSSSEPRKEDGSNLTPEIDERPADTSKSEPGPEGEPQAAELSTPPSLDSTVIATPETDVVAQLLVDESASDFDQGSKAFQATQVLEEME